MHLPLKPRVFTFYSFKGGVGRSMALLNCAYVLAGLGRRVLMVDMDLEAPGLSYLIEREKKGHGQSAGSEPNEPIFRRGVIELLTACAESPGDWPLARRADAGRIVEYLTDLEVPATLIRAKRPGSLSILPAGRIDADYERRLASIRWDQPPLGTQRDNLFRHLRNQVLAAGMFDYVLVDARTGFSDEGYLAARILADHLIVFCGMNQQNVLGTCQFLRQVQTWPPPESGDARKVVLVLSPVPEWEEEAKAQRRAEIAAVFREELGAETTFTHELPYHPRVAMWEEAIVARWPDSSLARAYEGLSRRLRQLAHDLPEDWTKHLAQVAQFDHLMSDDQIRERANRIERFLCVLHEQPDLNRSGLWPVLHAIQAEAERLDEMNRLTVAERMREVAVQMVQVLSDESTAFDVLAKAAIVTEILGKVLSGELTEFGGYLARGRLHRRLAEYRKARHLFQLALRASERRNDSGQATDSGHAMTALLHLADLDVVQGRFAEARRGLEQVLAAYRERGDETGVARVTFRLANLDRLQGDYTSALTGYRATDSMIGERPNRLSFTLSDVYAASCSACLRHPGSMERLQEIVDGYSRETADPEIQVRAQMVLAQTLLILERFSEALTTIEPAAAKLHELALREYLADAQAIQAIAHAGLGQHDLAIPAARSAIAFYDDQDVRSIYRDQLDQIVTHGVLSSEVGQG
jgi:cellulose biosynthesis protein BcsQ/tetratricopeptide (TPR) repeat protein